MIVRKRTGSYVLIRQHDHGQISGEFARRWRRRPAPFESTLYAIANHDVGWKKLDETVRWDEVTGQPHSFVDYPVECKLRAYGEGLDFLEARDAYAACLCSMHYSSFVRDSEGASEMRFFEGEVRRQERLEGGMSEAELENLERNFRLLQTCDDLSLFVCLNAPGENAYPRYEYGFEYMGARFVPVWKDRRTLRLEPNPLSRTFEVVIPYLEVGKDRQLLRSGRQELRVVTS